MKTARRLISLLLVLCLFVGDMGITAFAESVLALPTAMEIIEEEAFYGAKSLDKVVLPDHLKEIRARAFANSSVKTINLPSSLMFIADDAFDEAPLTNVTAVEGTYAYNWAVGHHYIIPKVPITIQSIRANVTTVETGTPITWTVVAEGGIAPLSYNYAVFKNGLYQDAFSISETDESYFALTPTSGGYWSVLVTITDSLDTVASEISESVYVVDIDAYGNIGLTLTTNLSTYLVGDTIQITAEKENAYGIVQYSFSAKDASDNVFASQNASASSSFGFTASEVGDITINGTLIDELGRSTSAQRTIHVYAENEIKPDAPQSIQMNGDTLPTNADQSVLYPQQNYKLSWDKVNNAESYHIQVIKTEGDTVTTLTDIDGYTETTYTIPADSFASIEQEALVQIQVSAQSRTTGDPAIGYFKVKTSEQQHTILVDGQFSAKWNEVFYNTAIRDFTVSSDVDWTFSSDHDWITCYRDENRLTVVLAENPYKTQVVNGIVTISNGSQSAQIVITHGYLEEAPQLLTPSLSQTEVSSTNQPYGDLYLKFDEKEADYVTAKLYKKNGSEYVYVAEESTSRSTLCLPLPTSIHTGDLCMLELIGYTEAGFQTKDISAQKTTTKYYFTFSNEQHFIQVDGQETSSYQIIDTVTVQIHASTVWSWQSDCDWLQITVSNDEFAPDCKAYIRAAANQTGEKRIGHLTITSGTSTAQITVMQDSFVPYVSYPTGLSQSANSPTTLPMNNLSFIWHMASYISIIRDSDGFVMLQSPSNPQTGDSIIDLNTESFEKADWKANSTYTITLSNDYYTSYYYFKIGTSNSYYINLSDSENSEVNILDWTVSAEAQTKTVTMKASGAWTITTDSDWLSVSATSGSKTTAGKAITVTVQQNTTGVNRNGNIIFKRGTYAEAVLHIEQAANNYLIVMNSETLVPYTNNDTIYHISGKNDDFSLKVKTGCSWSVSSDSSWLAFDRKGSTTKNVTSTNTTLRIYCEENTIGNQTRAAKLTFSAGNESFVLYISQDACIDVPVVSTTITSTNINNPSVILYQDINFTWSPVAGASKYVVKVMTSASDSTQQYYVEEDGSSEYSFTIPYSWLTVDGKAYFFRVNSIDQQGYEYTAPRYCYTVVYDEKATIKGSTQPSWNNASDYQASQGFIVMSTSSWTAVSQQSWIHVSPTSGESGDTLTVTLDDNTGARREGSVRISVNGNVTTLSISQCAKLAEWPTINTPAYSEDEYYPTIISSNISSLTVTWDVEPQADSYFIHLDSYKNTGTWHGEKEIENISVAQAGSYTINNLQLTADKLYKLTLVRCASGRGNAGTSVYFIPQNGLSTISLGSYDPSTAELDGEGGYQRYTINSSGTWIATTDSDWIMVYRNSLDQEDLDENGRTSSYYDSMVGNPGTALYISALANNTGAPRYGNVNVVCGSASLTVPVSQDNYVVPAKLIYPVISENASCLTSIQHEDLRLKWSDSKGGRNQYSVILKEKEPGDRTYCTAFEATNITNTFYSIPKKYLKEGYEYILILDSQADAIEDYFERYYFKVIFSNELSASISITNLNNQVGGYVAFSAKANGGAGNYQYAFEMLKNGYTLFKSTWTDDPEYSFPIESVGTYQIIGYVKDSFDNQSLSQSITFETDDIDVELPIFVDEILLDKSSTSIIIGDNAKLIATCYPLNADNRSVIWSSDNTSIATISDDGTVEGVAAGIAYITATAADGSGKTATCLVSVTPKVTLATSVKSSDSEDPIYLSVGEEVDIVDLVTWTVTPAGANRGLSFSSANSSVVEITEGGDIVAKRAGETYIYGTTKDGTNLSVIWYVIVQAKIQTLTIDKHEITIPAGKSVELNVSSYPLVDKIRASWSISDSDCIKILRGSGKIIKFKGLKTGAVILSVEPNDGGNGSGDTCIVHIVDNDVTPQAPKNVSASVSNNIITVTWANDPLIETYTVYYKIDPFGTSGKIYSIDTKANSVRFAGLENRGTHFIQVMGTTYTGEESPRSNPIQIVANKGYLEDDDVHVTDVNIAGNATLVLGMNGTMTAHVSPSYASNTDVNWSSSNTNIITVSGHGNSVVLVPKAEGTAIITATADDDENNAFASMSVTVQKYSVALDTVNISPSEADIQVGDTCQLTAILTPSNAVYSEICWESLNTELASIISSDTAATIVAHKAGYVTIRATITDANNQTITSDALIHIVGDYTEKPTVKLDDVVITKPENAKAVLQETLSIVWNGVDNADSYCISLRDITNNNLIINQSPVDTDLFYSVPANYLINGHKYRVAVGAQNGSTTSWGESIFFVGNSQLSVSVYGYVVSSLENPVIQAKVSLYAEDEGGRVFLLSTHSDNNGYWCFEGLAMQKNYRIFIDSLEYSFAEEGVELYTSSSTMNVGNIAANDYSDDEVKEFSVNTDQLNYSSDKESLQIVVFSDQPWTANSSEAWIHLSRVQGTGDALINVAVDENKTIDEYGDDVTNERSGSIVFMCGSERKTVMVYQDVPIVSTHVSYSSGETYLSGNQVFSQPTDIGSDMVVVGDLTIKAQTTLWHDATLTVNGNVTVQSGGILDLRWGGKLIIKGNFVFDSSKNHTDYLTKGVKYSADAPEGQK